MTKCFSFASQARNKVGIVTNTTTEDASGGRSVSSQVVADVWAVITPYRGYERLDGQRVDSHITHKVLIRYRSDMAVTGEGAKKWLRFSGRDMRVDYVKNLHSDLKREGKVYQEIFVKEGDKGAGSA